MNLLALEMGAIIGIVVAVVLVVLIVIWFISTYNSFVGMRTQGEEAFATMDVYLKKRYDLIPNIVNTVKGYAKHESELLEKITLARSRASSASSAEERIEAEAELSRALRSINVVVESYPALKADTSFLSLQASLNSIENEIAQSRKYYNAVAANLNKKSQQIPAVIVAKLMKIKKMPYFEVDDAEERKNVKVEF